ncbi:hypothetical protein [Archangium violaceum]|uniref:hypothetical protein n=1 Tax=Archangium violaceum TaxID=83451 RepID=UPI00126A1A65|nr:hypothetical protein [Archangium violaceum]
MALVAVLALAVVPLQLLPRGSRGELRAEQLPLAGADIDGDTSGLHLWPVDLGADAGPPRPGQGPTPLKGQKRAPCDQRYEVEASGVCWLPVQARPPDCPPQTVGYNGQCLLPLGQARAPPVSVDAGSP